MGRILIAGSGKTALDIGFYFLERNHEIHFTTSSPAQKTTLEKQLAKYHRRLQMLSENCGTKTRASCSLLNDIDFPAVDVVIETSSEILVKKQQIFATLDKLIAQETLLFSNSSSFLPQAIHPHCLGAHFLFPLLLTNLIELIVPPGCGADRFHHSIQFFSENNLDIITQDSKNAFLVNRLLLPLQAACCKAIQQGISPGAIDEASKCGIFPIGQLSLMDRVGLDIIHSAALQYTGYVDPEDLPNHEIMLDTINRLLQLGKKGKKNRDGLLTGQSLPWKENSQRVITSEKLARLFLEKLQSRCVQAIDREEISPDELTTVFTRVYQANDFQLSDLLEA